MAEHLELVAEIPKVEKLTVQERLEYAKKRRKQQLKRWEREKDSDYGPPPRKKKLRAKPVTFEPQFVLLEAATRGDVNEVKKILANGVDPNICNDDGLTALHQACIDGFEEIIDILLDNGAYLDSVDRELWTPLHAAAACGNDDIVEYLLDQGSNIVAINADGNMPIDLVDEDNEELREILQAEMEEQGYTEEKLNELKELEEQRMLSDLKKEFSANDSLDLDKKNEQGATMVHIAAANGYVEALEFLLEQGAAVDIADKDGWQPIHGAAVWGSEATVEMLVVNGADLDSKTPTGDTPLTLCEDPELQQFLVDLKNQVKANKVKSNKRKRSNSRSLSVKRTSLKDKITISQNEAKAEAILRVHPQLAFLLPKGSELKNKETTPMDTTPAVTNGEATQNSTTANVNREEDVNHVQDSKTSSPSKVNQKENIDPSSKYSTVIDKTHDNKEVVEKKSSFKVTIKTRSVSSDGKDDEQPTREAKPDITIGTTNADSKHLSQQSPTRNHAPKPDVTMGTQNTRDNRASVEPQEQKPQPDVTMVTSRGTPSSTKPATLPRDASTSKPPPGSSAISHNLGPKPSSDVNIARKTQTGSRTSGDFSHTGSKTDVASDPKKDFDKTAKATQSRDPLGSRNRLESESNTIPKSTKTRHAPPPPLPHSSGSLSRNHEPADTSGYPDSFSKRSRTSRENILDVVTTGRLASPDHKTVTPTDIKIEPAGGSAKVNPPQTKQSQPQPRQSPQPKQSQATQPQPKQSQPTQPQPKQAQPTQPQSQLNEPKKTPPKQQVPKETYRRKSSSENIAPMINSHVKDHDEEPGKKKCCILM